MSPFKAGDVFKLKSMVEFSDQQAVKKPLIMNQDFKLILIAIDHAVLEKHPAPMNALITVLEGKADLNYEGKEYKIKEGDSFAFDKGGEHEITCKDGKCKIALILFA